MISKTYVLLELDPALLLGLGALEVEGVHAAEGGDRVLQQVLLLLRRPHVHEVHRDHKELTIHQQLLVLRARSLNKLV